MAKEIERKFLVNKFVPFVGINIKQGYLSFDPEIRIRIKDDKKSLITIKSNDLLERNEFEYEIPVEDAKQLLSTCDNVINKTRYNSGRWEIDEFHDSLKGLWIAEIELKFPGEQVTIPDWVREEVTFDKRYYNKNLAKFGIPK